jgi:hypothetical protein
MHSVLPFDVANRPRRRYLLPGAVLLICAFLLRAMVAFQLGWQASPLSAALWVLLTAAHVAALPLLTASLLPPSRGAAWVTCALWASAAVVLECFEHPEVQAWLMRHAPMWVVMAVHGIVSLRQTGITRGFQPWEIAAALVGAGAAFLYLRRMSQ